MYSETSNSDYGNRFLSKYANNNLDIEGNSLENNKINYLKLFNLNKINYYLFLYLEIF